MLLLAFLNIILFAALAAVAWRFAALRVANPVAKRKATQALAWALGIGFLSLMTSVGMVIQDWGSVNLHLPGSGTTKARLWVQDRAGQPPEKSQVGRNMKIIADGVAFYKANPGRFSAENAARMDQIATLPTRPTRMLSPAEEGRIYEGARDVFAMISAIAGPTPTPSPTP